MDETQHGLSVYVKRSPRVRSIQRNSQAELISESQQEVIWFLQRKSKVYMTHFQISVAAYPYF